MDTTTILNDASARMQKAIDHLEEELLNIRAGKASTNVLNLSLIHISEPTRR